ncbi:ABC transporter permease [Rhodovulum sp. DZ06]|uniref:ABC transporter permease n=1 Tax=Rhodovulum sp. DZ06 TaxID=3425126 RepID=UPI003D34E085
MKRSYSLPSALYLLLFFTYLFGPLAVMAMTAFNSASFPRISPWDCLTTDWFSKLAADERLLEGIGNSVVIGFGVVCIAVPIGLAAAITLSQVGERLRAALYTVFIAPILVPGVVIGLSTLIFWDRAGSALGASYDSLFYDGIFLTIAGQVTFIASYSMLVFLSRIQRFDPTLTEAALDMGATPTQAFVKVLLPFMAPAIGSAAVLAFLASMENYNTTVFTVVAESTFTTVLASKVRYGIDPSISAVAVIIVGGTLVFATVFEAWRRRAARLEAGTLPMDRPLLRRLSHPATVAGIMAALVAGVLWWGSQNDSAQCELQILEQKRAVQEQLRAERLKAIEDAEAARKAQEGDAAPEAPAQGGQGGGVFAPGGLAPGGAAPAPASPAPSSPFSPGSLAPGGSSAPSSPFSPGSLAPGGSSAPSSPFSPGNLAPGGGG